MNVTACITVWLMSVLTIADHYDAELRRHNDHLRAATAIASTDRVLDIGCGAGQTTRDAARAASSGSVLGVDISGEMLERARRLTLEAGLENVRYEQGDAQVHRFAPASFDVLISRFGTMFFADSVAAFTNLAHAGRLGARLVMLVWQSCERNEWALVIPQAVALPDHEARVTWGDTLFSLAEPAVVEAVLQKSGFVEVAFTDVHEPVYYGPDVDTAYHIIRSFRNTKDFLGRLDADAASRALGQLRRMLTDRLTGDGVLFDSRAWIVTARVAAA
ncbi:MAG TPA: methyltransferase domain-containing protein [Steroidobacteraceae bacterium]|nr:methyltransferase domain-containing protein [Steroidobacteraceae bacterium]